MTRNWQAFHQEIDRRRRAFKAEHALCGALRGGGWLSCLFAFCDPCCARIVIRFADVWRAIER